LTELVLVLLRDPYFVDIHLVAGPGSFAPADTGGRRVQGDIRPRDAGASAHRQRAQLPDQRHDLHQPRLPDTP
jgi:hypothetical protein